MSDSKRVFFIVQCEELESEIEQIKAYPIVLGETWSRSKG
ncbi:uncharacterized protein G2W53_027732 [Senna tora]|uniref:Uncharacterized protein n=1 Tax=Senna tora TaxID=362788 RepID=A0A834WGV9_9FABA|nr:uncharacterized protein G2W53_027732 [Senna tora]